MIAKTKARRFLRSLRMVAVELLSLIRETLDPLTHILGLAFVLALFGLPLPKAFEFAFEAFFCISLSKVFLFDFFPGYISGGFIREILPLALIMMCVATMHLFGILK